jgi:DivIVA domain-containing protein
MGFFGSGGGPRASAMTAAAVEAAVFTQTRFREGYDLEEVDAFLARCAASIRWAEGGSRPSDPVTADDVVAARFRPTKFRAGYDQDQVDDLLDRIVVTLRAEPRRA